MPTGGKPGRRGGRRLVVAMVLIALATWAIVDEPFSGARNDKGRVLLTITQDHGVDATDLPAIGLYMIAAGLIASWFAATRP